MFRVEEVARTTKELDVVVIGRGKGATERHVRVGARENDTGNRVMQRRRVVVADGKYSRVAKKRKEKKYIKIILYSVRLSGLGNGIRI